MNVIFIFPPRARGEVSKLSSFDGEVYLLNAKHFCQLSLAGEQNLSKTLVHKTSLAQANLCR